MLCDGLLQSVRSQITSLTSLPDEPGQHVLVLFLFFFFFFFFLFFFFLQLALVIVELKTEEFLLLVALFSSLLFLVRSGSIFVKEKIPDRHSRIACCGVLYCDKCVLRLTENKAVRASYGEMDGCREKCEALVERMYRMVHDGSCKLHLKILHFFTLKLNLPRLYNRVLKRTIYIIS